jgi:molybdenum cofactor cytidylyltransferase
LTVGALGAVVLAAGASARLGRPKQLVVHEGRPLVVRAADAATRAGADPVVVVLGAEADAVRAVLADLPVVQVMNSRWADGMGTSVAEGLRAIMKHTPALRGVLLTLADQPLVDHAALARLLAAWDEADAAAGDGGAHVTIAAASYAGTVGVPAVFGRAHFDSLRSLAPGAGAAALLRDAGARVLPVPMPEAATDIDTPVDLERLRAHEVREARA